MIKLGFLCLGLTSKLIHLEVNSKSLGVLPFTDLMALPLEKNMPVRSAPSSPLSQTCVISSLNMAALPSERAIDILRVEVDLRAELLKDQ